MDNQPVAAVMLRSPEGRILMMRRVDDGTWAFPAGGIKDGETPEEGAWRECWEETGHRCGDVGKLHMRRVKDGVDCSTFLCEGVDEFIPKLNHEHDAWGWFPAEHALADDSTAGQRADDARADGPWREEEHPRGKGEKGGQFVKKGEGGWSEGGEEPQGKREPFQPAQAKGGGAGGAWQPPVGKAMPGGVKYGKPQTSKATPGWKHSPGKHTGVAPPESRVGFQYAPMVNKAGKWVRPDGKPLGGDIGVPPGWSNVYYVTNVGQVTSKKGDLRGVGRDAKGVLQSIYSAAHHANKRDIKFSRILQLQTKDIGSIRNENQANRRDPKLSAFADCLALVMEAAIRPGSEEGAKGELSAKGETIGATTLTGANVKTKGGRVILEFTGKHTVPFRREIVQPDLAKMLVKRAQAAGRNGLLFGDAVNDDTLRSYSKGLGGNAGYRPKDFRTLIGTNIAQALVKGFKPKPVGEKAIKAAKRAISTQVSVMLNNKPSEAEKSYIDPSVWEPWNR